MLILVLFLFLMPSALWASEWPESEFDLKSFKSSLEKDYFSCYLDQIVGFRDGEPVLYNRETITVIIGRDITTTKGDGFFGGMELDFHQSLPSFSRSSRFGDSLELRFPTRQVVVTLSMGIMGTGSCQAI